MIGIVPFVTYEVLREVVNTMLKKCDKYKEKSGF